MGVRKEEIIMWACCIGEISDSYKEKWEPHTVDQEIGHPDIFDVIVDRWEIGYRLDMRAAEECFSDCIQVDWGGWAYKVTTEQILKYNEKACSRNRIAEDVAFALNPEKEYAIIDVELY